jgi:3-hydroxyanthranilate 3,4-dioxygenase
MLDKAIDFGKWIEEHRHLFKPPVCNKQVFEDGEFIVMVVGGPNVRKDYHVNEGPEFFYQLEGEMVLGTMQEGKPVDIPIRAGEIFLLPPTVPHSPRRMENSLGLVIERKRRPEEMDGLQWYCEECDDLLYEEFFPLVNIEKDLPPVFDRFFASEAHRTCQSCGAVMAKPGE